MSILDELGFDPDEVRWQDLAACKNVVQVFYVNEKNEVVEPEVDLRARRVVYDPLFDSYEEDEPPYVTRRATDTMCMSCPVQKMCYEYGRTNRESGVWGGVYMTNGRADRTRNEHKSPETWRRIREVVGQV